MIFNGIYAPLSNFAVKGSQDVRFKVGRPIAQTTALDATATTTTQAIEIAQNGDLAGLLIQIKVTAGGTLSSPTKLEKALATLNITDASGVSIWDGISGSDLKYLELALGLRGKIKTETDNNNTAVTDSFEIPCSVDARQLPMKVTPTLAAYSALASSGCTSGSVTLTIVPVYRDGITSVTNRIRKVGGLSVGASTTSLAPYLPRDRRVLALGFLYTAAYLTNVSLSRDGTPEFTQYDAQSIVAHEFERFSDGHQSGFVLLEPGPAIDVTDKTLLDWTSGTADTLSMFQFLQDYPKQ